MTFYHCVFVRCSCPKESRFLSWKVPGQFFLKTYKSPGFEHDVPMLGSNHEYDTEHRNCLQYSHVLALFRSLHLQDQGSSIKLFQIITEINAIKTLKCIK